MAFSSVEGLLQAAGQGPLWRAVLEDDLRERGGDEARSWGSMTPPPAPAAASPAARGPGWRGRGRGCALPFCGR